MDLSSVLNIILSGGLTGAVAALLTIRSTARKAAAEAEKASADAQAARMDNAEHATRILMENIVEPLKKELHATRREMARLRKAIERASGCPHRDGCPVLDGLRAPQADAEEPRTDGDGERADAV